MSASTSFPDPNAKVMVSSPHGPIRVPMKDLDKIKLPSFIGSTEFTKDAYQKHRAAFRNSFPYEKTIGMINPYTGEKIHTESDYELYCLSFYLKCTAEEELSELRKSNDSLVEENNKLKQNASLAYQRGDLFEKRLKTHSIVFFLSLYLLLFITVIFISSAGLIVPEWFAPLILVPYCLAWCFSIASDWRAGRPRKHKFTFFVCFFIILSSVFIALMSQFSS